MTPFKADLHIHTVLSPCGDLEMSPSAIVSRALARGLDMIAITDHNTTRQVKVTQKIGRASGLFVLGGVEVTSQEEAHCLSFFETDEQLDAVSGGGNWSCWDIDGCTDVCSKYDAEWMHECWRYKYHPER